MRHRSNYATIATVVLWWTCVPIFAQNVSFAPRQDYATGVDPRSATFGDFNGDGRIDIVVANSASNGTGGDPSLSVFLGNGNGGFSPSSVIPITTPYSIASADFNGDGRRDLVVTHVDMSTLSILLGNGNGTFQAPQTLAAGGKPFSVTPAQINNDGIVDLVVANYQAPGCCGTGNVQVLLGNGNGTFHSAGTWLPSGDGAFYVAIADFNKDSIPDIAASLDGSVGVLFGNGDGTMRFGPVVSGGGRRGITAGDFNGDGSPDFASTEWNSTGRTVVVLGNGNGTFQAPMNAPGDTLPWGMTSADFNGDGRLDIVTANSSHSNISVLTGNGDGPFQPPINIPTGAAPYFAGVSDFNNDGLPDLAVTNGGSYTLSILLNSAGPPNTIWNTPTNAIAGQNSLTKAGGCNGCYDAGASTKASVSSGDAYVDFQFGDPNGLARAGFAHAFNVNAGTSQDFALRVQGGVAEVRERGIYRTDISFGAGTTFRIAVHNGVVTYAKNGVVFYTSSDPVQYPFVFGVILGNANTSVNSVVFTAATTPPPPPPPDGGGSGGGSGGGGTGGGGTGGSGSVTWSSMSNVTFDGATVRKSSGCDGCFDAFVQSAQTLGTSGYVEFSVSNTTPYLLGGLTRLFMQGDYRSIDYGIRVQGGYAEVRENGIYRSDIAAQPGAVFRITVSGGAVSYSKDGFVFYSGPITAGTYSFATLFANMDASISNVVISSGP